MAATSHLHDPPKSACGQRDGTTGSVMLRAERHFTVYSPVKATKPQTGCANKVREPVDEERPGTARDASTLEVKPDAGLKVLGWIPKRYCAFSPMPRGKVSSCQACGKIRDLSPESGVEMRRNLKQSHFPPGA